MFNVEIAKEIVDYAEGRPYFGYSGRGMFGGRCFGIICEYPGDLEDFCENNGIEKPLIDNMGLEYIAYWPNTNIMEGEYNMSNELNEDVVEMNDDAPEMNEEEMEEVIQEEEEAEEVVAPETLQEEDEEVAIVEDVQEEEEEVVAPSVVLTEKQVILMNIFKSDIDKYWLAPDLANETTELTKRQINGVLASMKKKGVIVKNVDGWKITRLGMSC